MTVMTIDYERGLRTLKAQLPPAAQTDFLVYENRLRENQDRERRYGSTETIRAERAAIVDSLNQLALTHLGISFNALCRQTHASTTPAPETSLAPHRDAPTAPNPFGDTGRIVDPARFFGREELQRQAFEELGKGVSLALIGESRIGKSSLLWMICKQGPTQMSLPPEEFAYLSLELVDNEDEFYEALCDSLKIETCRGYKLTRALQGRRYILCLDEIEKMTWDGFTARVRSHLRGLADGDGPLKLVIAGRKPLAQLFPDSDRLTSPLAGICRQIDVGPFTPTIARGFLMHRLQGTGISFTEEQVFELITTSGGHPAKLQDAAAALYRRLAQDAARSTP